VLGREEGEESGGGARRGGVGGRNGGKDFSGGVGADGFTRVCLLGVGGPLLVWAVRA
jgi:hypothetical protein